VKTLLGLLLFLGFTPLAASAATPAALNLTMTSAGVQAQTQEHYPANAPVAVEVKTDVALHVKSVAAVLAAPSGSKVRVPLAALGDGRFSGTLTLSEPGSYSVALSTLIGGASIDSGAISLNVVAAAASVPQHVEWAAFGIIPILGFTLAGRLRRRAGNG